MTEESEVIKAHNNAARAATSLLNDDRFKTLWTWLQNHYDVTGPSLSRSDLTAPNIDGMSKALIGAYNDGVKDVFSTFNGLTEWKPESQYNEEKVNS